jgi:hypothetical protein
MQGNGRTDASGAGRNRNGQGAATPEGRLTMQLDHYNIAIRERPYIDILDLALRVFRAHAGPLLVLWAVGATPMIVLDRWLLADLRDFDFQSASAYMLLMTMLVVWQVPLAMAPATLYLGQAVFVGRPDPKAVARDFRDMLPQLVLYQGLVRAVLLLLVVTWPMLFTARAYLSEIILLERNPLRSRTPETMTTMRRCRNLHAAQTGDLFAQWIGAAAVGLMLLLSIWFSIWCVGVVLSGNIEWEDSMFGIYFEVALWLVVGFFGLVRFLGYLDLRIRREGWEVELVMRAERARLSPEMAGLEERQG